MTVYKRHTIILLLLLISLLPGLAQIQQDQNAIRQQRFSMIEYYHFGVGIEAGMNKNLLLGPKVYVGIGSFRNLFNADIGLKLLWMNPFLPSKEESVSLLQLPLFISASVNFLRWQNGAAYFGGTMAYHLSLGASHHINDGNTTYSDSQLANNHASAEVKLGIRLNNWDISLFGQRDLAPAFNQKYVYETAGYDYNVLYNTIFERLRFGMSVNYIIPF